MFEDILDDAVETLVAEGDLTLEQIDTLVVEGWGDRDLDDRFRNNGQRVSTYVVIAMALGEPAPGRKWFLM